MKKRAPSSGRRATRLLAAAVLLSSASDARAQWFVSGSWGASEDLDATTSGSVQSFQLGIQGYTDAGRLLVLGGVPVRPSEDLTWGLAEAASSPFLGGSPGEGFGLQPDLLARGFLYHDPVAGLDGAGGLLLAEPYVAYSGRKFRARLGGGARASGTRMAGVSAGRTAGVAAGDVLLVAARRLTVRVRGEVLHLDSGSLPRGAIGLQFDHDGGSLWAGLDRWEADATRETGWHAGGSLDLAPSLSARVSFGRTSGEPLFDTPARRVWSVGLRYRFAERPGVRPGDALPQYAPGSVHLRVPASEGRGTLSVGGSFNGWQPVPMTRNGDDWTIQLDLESGYYELAFVDETGRWFVPESMPGRRRDGMGGWVMILVVS